MKEQFKTYGYLPIFMDNETDKLTDHPEFHQRRFIEALTELIANIAIIKNEQIREVLTRYHAILVEKQDGSRSISVSFPEKRFS